MSSENPLTMFKASLNTFFDKIKHPEKDSLLIDDIFVYPHVKCLEDGEIIDSNNLFDSERNITFIGSEYSGKTSLCNKITIDLLAKDYGIIKLNGSDIKEANAKKLFEKQERKENFFHEESYNGKKVLLIDNIQDLSFNDKYLELFFSSSIEFYDMVILFCLERDYFSKSVYGGHSEVEGYRIQDFGYIKRDELYSKWLSVGNPSIQTIGNNEYHERVDSLTGHVESVIRNNVVDAKPIFILTILQTHENFSTRNYSMTSLGECYSVLLHSLLSKNIKYESYDSVISFLSYLSFSLLDTDRDYFSETDFDKWLNEYSNNFIILDNIKNILIKSNVIYIDSSYIYRFNQQYIFYYCAGKYIADNYIEMSSVVEDICQNLNNEKKANVLIFLVHHARNKDLIDTIILYSSEFLKDLSEFDITKDSEFFQEFLKELKHDYRKDSTRENRQKMLKSKDDMIASNDSVEEIKNRATDRMEPYISETDKMNKQLKMLDEAGSALRSIEVIGQVLKNRFGSLPTNQIEYAIEQCNTLGFKVVNFFIDTIIMTEEEFIKVFTNLIMQNELLNSSEANDKAKNYVRLMAFNLSYFIIDLVAKSISQKQIEETISISCENNSHKIINLAVKLRLHPRTIPREYIQEILNENHGLLFEKLINQIVYDHLYLYELNYQDLQWVYEKLKINFKPAHFNRSAKLHGNSNHHKTLSIEKFKF